MKKQWNRFFWPMTGLVAALLIVTGVSYWKYGATFWITFYPQFLATVFGVVFSIMFAWALWRLQQRAQERHLREQLIKNLKFEVDENIRRLQDTTKFLENTGSMRGLRTVASKHVLKPENLAILGDVQVEDGVELMLEYAERYNAILAEASSQFHNDLQSGRTMEEAVSQLRTRIFSGGVFEFLQGFLKHLSERIGRLG